MRRPPRSLSTEPATGAPRVSGSGDRHLTVESHADGTAGWLRPAGDVDLSTFRRLRDAGTALLSEGVRQLELDCSGITFIDSTGLGTLAELTKLTERLGGRLVLRDPVPMLSTLLQITGLDGFLTIEVSDPSLERDH